MFQNEVILTQSRQGAKLSTESDSVAFVFFASSRLCVKRFLDYGAWIGIRSYAHFWCMSD